MNRSEGRATAQAIVAALCGREVRSWTSVSGGDIHIAGRAELEDGQVVFAKFHPNPPVTLFETEALGLRWLSEMGSARTPAVLAYSAPDSAHEFGGLVLQWIESSRPSSAHLQRLADMLASLHNTQAQSPGWSRPGFIGPLNQSNEGTGLGWTEFWRSRRIQAGLELAAMHLDTDAKRSLSHVVERCDELLRGHGPMSPLHGDLWAGNVVWGPREPWLIDPAPYVGDPEVDLAMMSLFGGFGGSFWRAYERHRPPTSGWRRRRAVYQLWPLLVHVALFGRGYLSQLKATARAALQDDP